MTQKNPKISLITPSFNQGDYIEKTITSVLGQNYPNLEYLIIDGGSTDQTLDILKKYSAKIFWISEKDKGQSDAINKGLKKAKGEIVGFINSDDYLQKNSLRIIADFFSSHQESFWVTGKCKIVNEKGDEVRNLITLYKNFFLKFLRFRSLFHIVQFISQPATFWRREVIKKVGLFDQNLHYSMDYDYWLRIWQHYRLDFIDKYLAAYRIHYQSKAVISPETQFQTEHEILKRYTSSPAVLFFHLIHIKFALFFYKLFSSK